MTARRPPALVVAGLLALVLLLALVCYTVANTPDEVRTDRTQCLLDVATGALPEDTPCP